MRLKGILMQKGMLPLKGGNIVTAPPSLTVQFNFGFNNLLLQVAPVLLIYLAPYSVFIEILDLLQVVHKLLNVLVHKYESCHILKLLAQSVEVCYSYSYSYSMSFT